MLSVSIDALDPFSAPVFDLSGLNERRPVLGRPAVVETVFDVTAVREFTPSRPAAIVDFLRIEIQKYSPFVRHQEQVASFRSSMGKEMKREVPVPLD